MNKINTSWLQFGRKQVKPLRSLINLGHNSLNQEVFFPSSLRSFTCCTHAAFTPPATEGDFHQVTQNNECYMFSKSRAHSYSPVGNSARDLSIRPLPSNHSGYIAIPTKLESVRFD